MDHSRNRLLKSQSEANIVNEGNMVKILNWLKQTNWLFTNIVEELN